VIYEETLEAAISRCDEESQCGCFSYNGAKYYLYKGTEIKDSSSYVGAWVKT